MTRERTMATHATTQVFAPNKVIGSFHPPKRILMGPGPSEIHPRVLAASSAPSMGYLDPVFVGMMDEIKQLIRYAYQTKNQLTFPLSGPGSVGMESSFVNMVEPGDAVIVMRNGVFGGRMVENVQRSGGKAIVIDDPWGSPCDPNKLREALQANPSVRTVGFVHAETSTGAESDAKTLTGIAHEFGALVICDAVTSLAGVPLLVDEWAIDAVYSGSQKCLSCVPGLSPVSYSDAVIDRVKARKDKAQVQSWFMDLNLVLDYWGETARTYHHTAPINSLFALHESLVMLQEESLEQSWARHRLHHEAFKAGIEAMGLKFLVHPDYRLPQMNAVNVPESFEPGVEAQLRKRLLADYSMEIGAGLGPLAGKIWRFGLMGQSCSRANVMSCLGALTCELPEFGVHVKMGDAEQAALNVYNKAAQHQA
jgi:alanine-glyoxylate transaminase/serine-glyoxylate transaminase/serine-pyruvate transaminase